MGANHSHADDLGLWNSSLDKNIKNKHGTLGMSAKQRSAVQGKPSPPSGVSEITDITHNSLMLSWQPPKSTGGGNILAYTIKIHVVKKREWLTLTKSCQGNHYLVKNLEPNSTYQFRVRAENIYGCSKPGSCSEIVQTNNFNFQKVPSPSTERKSPTLKRRHSVNIHVEGTVANILNHSDPVVKTSVSSGALNDKTATFLRDVCYRTSLQTTRKRSVNSILPGTKTDSLLKLKDSQVKQNSNKNSVEDITRTCSHESSLDKTEGESCTDDHSVMSDSFVRDVNSHNGDIDETDGPENKNSDISESTTGDIKIVLSSRTKSSEHIDCSERGLNEENIIFASEPHSPRDFRTLRNMLNSSDIIIKSSRSMPEISDECKTNNVTHSHTLSTIVDEEIDDDSVQVTTL